MARPTGRVAVIFTGGTISMRPDPDAGGARPMLDGAAILALAPEVARIADLDVVDWGMVPASHLRFAQLIEIWGAIARQLARPEIHGVVVVQGTDTIEETAFAYDLLRDSDKPIVVTGAMRDASSADYDGPQNLADAVRCAMAAELHGLGVVVVMAGSVVGAAVVVKHHASSLDTFRAREGEPIATVVDGVVRVMAVRAAAARRHLARRPAAADAVEDVHLVTAAVGSDGALIRGLGQLRPAGLVVAATGSGNTHPDMLAAAGELMADGTVVVLTTRCGAGSVAPTYAFPGGGATWQRAGALLSGLDGPKSRVALALGLAARLDRGELAELIAP